MKAWRVRVHGECTDDGHLASCLERSVWTQRERAQLDRMSFRDSGILQGLGLYEDNLSYHSFGKI